MFRLLAVCAVSLLFVTTAHSGPGDAEHGQKAILVTGASTGIGRHLAESLAADGHFVYAGARKDKDLAELDAIDNIKAVRLDVTKQDQVDAAVALVESEGRGLWGLVNNAGVGGGGLVVDTPVEDQMWVYDINVAGVYRVTRAFAPLVIESKGRIMTTGSIAGTLSWPAGNAYSGSKHAIEAFTDSLAGEMEPHGVQVSVIEPGNYKSNIRRSSVARRMGVSTDEMTEEQKAAYEETAARELAMTEPDEVTEAFKHALFADTAMRRYMVVPNREEADWTVRQKITELLELNEWSEHAYSRDEIVAAIDEIIAAQDAGASD